MTVASLIDFLLLRISEDEHMAREQLDYEREREARRPPLTGAGYPAPNRGWFRPDRIVADCQAKRRIVEAHRHEQGQWILATLATAYSDHPDYRDEWRP